MVITNSGTPILSSVIGLNAGAVKTGSVGVSGIPCVLIWPCNRAIATPVSSTPGTASVGHKRLPATQAASMASGSSH